MSLTALEHDTGSSLTMTSAWSGTTPSQRDGSASRNSNKGFPECFKARMDVCEFTNFLAGAIPKTSRVVRLRFLTAGTSGGAGFSLRGFDLARTKTHRLKPVLLVRLTVRWRGPCLLASRDNRSLYLSLRRRRRFHRASSPL